MRYLTWNEYLRLALSYAVFSRNDDGSLDGRGTGVARLHYLGRNPR